MSEDKDKAKHHLKLSLQAKRDGKQALELHHTRKAVSYMPDNAKMAAALKKLEEESEKWDGDVKKELEKLALDEPAKSASSAATPPAPPSAEQIKVEVLVAKVEREGDNDLPEMPALVRLERRDAGEGRGQGMFALEDIKKALSVVFDPHCQRVCGFCFSPTGPTSPAPSTPLAEPIACVCPACARFAWCKRCYGVSRLREWHRTECAAYCRAPEGAKRGDSSVLRLLCRYKALTSLWPGPPAPAADAEGEAAAAGEGAAGPSVKLMELRDWADSGVMGKEPVTLLSALEGHSSAKVTSTLQPAQLQALGRIVGLPPASVAMLILQIRTNAASIVRPQLGEVGCSLSAYMGFTNHDCDPSMRAEVDAEGFLKMHVLRDIPKGEEASISYVDTKLKLSQRQAKLKEQYQFVCICKRCEKEASGGSGGKKKGKKKKGKR